MRLALFRTRSAPLALVVIVALLAQIFPVQAWAAADPPRTAPADWESLKDTLGDLKSSDELARDQLNIVKGPRPVEETTSAVPKPESVQDGPTNAPPTQRASSSKLSLPQGAAKLRGMGESFSAELSTGIARYQVPFDLPASRGGAQPSLGLVYSSAGGHGLAGVGWGIGVPAISRQIDRGVPKYQDPAVGGPWHPEQDRFVSGADELVPVCLVSGTTCSGAQSGEVMPAWASGWQYFRARVDGAFLRYFWSPDHRTWRVQAKTGVSIELGVPLDGSSDESALEVDPLTPSRIYAWHATRTYDQMGNANPSSGQPQPVNIVQYKYTTVEGTSYLTDIFDTPPAANAATAPTSAYAHHTRLRYEQRPDSSTSYRRGWAARVTLRLQGVDVTSHEFLPTATRQLVRRYHLAYDPISHISLLASVQMEGRCATAVAEISGGALPATTSCPRLPAMTFGYQHVAPFKIDGSQATADLPGYEGFDERLKTMATSPPHSISETLTDLADIDSDGLPDVLVTDPARYGGNHGVFFNKGTAFASATTMQIEGVLGADSNVLKFNNPNISSHDVDGDGIINLLHMPLVKTYSVYAPRKRQDGTWAWQGRAVTTASQQDAKINFAGRNPDIRFMDVNADGLIDVVYTPATEMHTFLSLGRYPGGNDQYGSASWTSGTSAQISNEPLRKCIPWSASPIRFSDPDVHVADMNGDGFPDIVRVRHGDVRYWPGRGNGYWGIGEPSECPAGGFGQDQHVAMEDSPRIFAIGDEPFLLDDINGDGLSDLVRVRFNAIDIYLNVNGVGWTDRHVIDNAPPNSSVTNRVRLADVNGSGTADILWGDGFSYKYIDLMGGARPWVLTKVDNGLGATTELEYTTSVQQMLAAEASGQPWSSKAPSVAHVLSRVTNRDNLDRVGRPAGVYAKEYTYRDAVYEGRQREFRGFRSVRVRVLGDTNSPTSISETTFLLGECVDEPGFTCEVGDRWRDNPREALKGLPVIDEQSSEAGDYLSTAHTTYRLRRLYSGLDGRDVRNVFVSSSDTYRYDTSPFAASTSSVILADVELETTIGTVTPDAGRSVSLRSSARARIRQSATTDRFGNALDQFDHGCVEGCSAVDETIQAHSVPQLVSGDLSGWIWRTAESWVQGDQTPSVHRKHVSHVYDARGQTTLERIHVTGTLPLDRFHDTTGRAIAPAPANAIIDGTYDTFNFDHDAFGNTVQTYSALGHCEDAVFDAAFAQLIVQASTSTGYPESTVGMAACGPYKLTSSGDYDRGLGVVTRATDRAARIATATYDGFGRVTAINRTHPETGAASPLATAIYEYNLPTDGVRPYTMVHERVQDGEDVATSSYRDTWTYADGLGRTIVTLSQADPSAGDDGQWTASGFTDYDAKGAMRRAFLSSFYTGEPAAYPLAAPVTTRSASSSYDAFGRVLETHGLEGEITQRNAYHAMSTEASDAADLETGGSHANTPSLVRVDGHGRTVSSIQRVRVQAQIQDHETKTTYLPTGEPEVIRRTVPGGSDIVRWMRYDSFGHMVLNVDPNTTKTFSASPTTNPDSMKAWRYAYDRLGQLVGTSDPNGCGTNFFMLADGRPLGQDYSPCKAHHADYTAPDLTSITPGFVKGDGLESLLRFDVSDPEAVDVPGFSGTPLAGGSPVDQNAGQLASVSDRGSKALFRYDRRGRAIGVARKMVKPGVPTALLANRYTPHWYVKASAYDAADRVVEEQTGADEMLLFGSDGDTVVSTVYSKRGTVKSVGGSYGALVQSVTRDADGLIQNVVYGDAASTTTAFTYDLRQRLSTVVTDRGPPTIWSSPPASYTPAPNPSGPPTVFQSELENLQYAYDAVGNPLTIEDQRDPSNWPAGFKPVTRTMQYDDLYRLTQSQQVGTDNWVSPFAEENANPTGRTLPMPHVSFPSRMAQQTFAYDAVGNMTTTDDDAHGFFDRSLGTITNGTASAGPYQLKQASNGSGTRSGALTATYDDAGHLTSLALQRNGPCVPAGAICSQRFAYDWDEVGNLARARRWDLSSPGAASDPLPSGSPAVDLRYSYGGMERVLKTAVDASSNELHSVYIFASLELRRAEFSSGEYEHTSQTEASYLFGHGVRLARVYYAEEDLPTLTSGHQHVLLELTDHLGSASFVIDRATSELVEATRYQAYGSTESDYRPDRWNGYRADHRFTGKEEDIEVGLSYFGARYFSPQLNRWISPDPLAVQDPMGRGDLNLYAYVNGRVWNAVDPTGLFAFFAAAAIGATLGGATYLLGAAVAGRAPNADGAFGASVVGAIAPLIGGVTGSLGSIGPGVGAGAKAIEGAAWGTTIGTTAALYTSGMRGLDFADTFTRGFEGAGVGGAGGGLAGGLTGGSLGGASLITMGGGAGGGSSLLAMGGAINAGLGGARHIYNWKNGTGFGTLGVDSTWGLLGTALGSVWNIVNITYDAANGKNSFNKQQSEESNRHIYRGGIMGRGRVAHTQGNVISGPRGMGFPLRSHEQEHITTSRVFGAFFQSSYVSWMVVAGGLFLPFAPLEPRLVETMAYYNNPWEAHAFENYTPSGRNGPTGCLPMLCF